LHEWLAESARVGGDDVTMALLIRDEPDTGGSAPALAAAPRPPRRGGIVAIAAVLGLLVGALIGWLVGAAQDDSPAPAVTATTSAPAATGTSTTAPPPNGTATPPAAVEQDRLVIVAPQGQVVEFTPTADDPQARLVQTRPALTPTAALWWSGADWTIEQSGQGTQVVRRAAESSVPDVVRLDGAVPGGLLVAPGGLWVVSDDARKLALVDADGQQTAGWFDVEVS
jgi:hypothetical protein